MEPKAANLKISNKILHLRNRWYTFFLMPLKVFKWLTEFLEQNVKNSVYVSQYHSMTWTLKLEIKASWGDDEKSNFAWISLSPVLGTTGGSKWEKRYYPKLIKDFQRVRNNKIWNKIHELAVSFPQLQILSIDGLTFAVEEAVSLYNDPWATNTVKFSKKSKSEEGKFFSSYNI